MIIYNTLRINRMVMHRIVARTALPPAKHCNNHCLEFVGLTYLGFTEIQNGICQAARAVIAAWA